MDGATVLITGGAGFLGRALVHHALFNQWKTKFVIVSRDPHKHNYMRVRYPNANIAYVLSDILDTQRLQAAMAGCDLVVHAAALKHLPECEINPGQAVAVNIDGSRSVFAAATAARVSRVVAVSTDKAAEPSSFYGMTKAVMEHLMIEEAMSSHNTEFTGVRYGNVICSTGSVWHVFKDRARQGLPLQVTDPAMTRFFVPISQAVELVLHAATAPTGVIAMPAARALSIGDLARYITELNDLPDYEVTGTRPGEKNHESMLGKYEADRVGHVKDDIYWLVPEQDREGYELSAYPTPTSSEALPLEPKMFVAVAKASEEI